jgi:hypothetical protein
MLGFIIVGGAVITWLYVHRDGCHQRKCDAMFNNDGFSYIDNFLPTKEFDYIKKTYVKETFPMYPDNTYIIGNEQKKTFQEEDHAIVKMVKEKVEKIVQEPLFVDYAFLRYYNGKAPNPFEFFHLDSKHFDHDVIQIRTVINLYDKSVNGTFCYKSKCCAKGKTFCNQTKPNSLTLIQANKLRHKFEYSGGERLIYVIDFTTSYKRGLYGSVWGSWDYIWDRMQKWLTSFHN